MALRQRLPRASAGAGGEARFNNINRCLRQSGAFCPARNTSYAIGGFGAKSAYTGKPGIAEGVASSSISHPNFTGRVAEVLYVDIGAHGSTAGTMSRRISSQRFFIRCRSMVFYDQVKDAVPVKKTGP